MAKETAAERNLRFATEAQAELDATRANYPNYFRRVLSAALLQNIELTKVDYVTGEYTMHDRDEGENYIVWDTFVEHGECQWLLERLESRIMCKVREMVIAAQKRELRATALGKLNAAEREVLGL